MYDLREQVLTFPISACVLQPSHEALKMRLHYLRVRASLAACIKLMLLPRFFIPFSIKLSLMSES